MIDKKTLENEYCLEKMTFKEIALRHGVSSSFIGKLAKKYGIKTRKRGADKKVDFSKKELQLLYENKTCKQISNEFNISAGHVARLLRENGIELKTPNDYAKSIDVAILEELYINQQLSYREISEKLNCSVSVVRRNILDTDIQPRPSYNSLGKSCSLQTAKKISEALKGKPKSECHKRKLSESKLGDKNFNFGKKCNHPKRYWYCCPDGKWVSMRSNWEVAYAEFLCSQKIKWQYEPKTFILSNGSAYTPDFFLLKTEEYIEVKGWLRPKYAKKIDMFYNDYPECKLILANKKYLEELGIDLKAKFKSTRPKFDCEFCESKFFRMHKKQRFCSVTCRNRYVASNRNINVVNEIY